MNDGHPYLAGWLLAMTGQLLERIERCDRHDSWMVARERAQLDAIQRVLRVSGWTEDDIRAAVNEAIPA